METKKLIGAAAFSIALAGGGVAGALLGSPGSSGAQESSTTSTTAPDAGANATPGPGDHHGFRFGRGPGLAAAATAIGITEDELKTALQSGQSLAQVAVAHGKTAQDVIDVLVADATARIDAKVASGEVTSDQATELKSHLTERITELVNHSGGFRHRFGHGPGAPDDETP